MAHGRRDCKPQNEHRAAAGLPRLLCVERGALATIAGMSTLQHWRGLVSLAGVAVAPLGRFVCRGLRHLATPERLERGLVLVLPGIESESTINHGIARGMAEGGVDRAIAVFDWTTGLPGLFLMHLRFARWNRAAARRLVQAICRYQDEYPGRPVHLVGHSGGGAMAVMALERLPEGRTISGAILLAAAISPRYDLRQALARTELGIWNFHSPLDLAFLGAATLLLGTIDGKHVVAAGALGFQEPREFDDEGRRLYGEKLHQQPYRLGMARAWNLGGHFGSTNRAFAAARLAPIVMAGTKVVR
jgi:pimeloyl-ACP methyl ester carboxylesterase